MSTPLPTPPRHPFWQGVYDHEAGLDEYDNPYTDDYSRAAWEHGREQAAWAELEENRDDQR